MRLDTTTLTDNIAHSLPLADWGFSESAKTDWYVIFNSHYCRLKFEIERDRNNDLVHYYYGRLHAVDNSYIMKWNGEDNYCWHSYGDLHIVLRFLDGLTPQDAFQAGLTVGRHHLFDEYFNSEQAKLAASIGSNLAIWETYGVRFFELFDLQHPSLWEAYLKFLEEYYELYYGRMIIGFNRKGLTYTHPTPPYQKKC
jgi:hypothetical protein